MHHTPYCGAHVAKTAGLHIAICRPLVASLGQHTSQHLRTTLFVTLTAVQMVFSSSCTVYGDVQKEHVPIKESTPLGAMSPYGRTKLVIEDMMRDLAKSDPEWRIILLRYFNPVGAHPSGGPLAHSGRMLSGPTGSAASPHVCGS